MLVDEGGELRYVLREHGKAPLAHPHDDLVHVEGVEQHDRIEDEPQGAELVFHALMVAVYLAAVAVEDLSGKSVAGAWISLWVSTLRRESGSSKRSRRCVVFILRPYWAMAWPSEVIRPLRMSCRRAS